MLKHEEKVFTYNEALPIWTIPKLPEVITFKNPSYEALLFRLLLGTINITHNHEKIIIKQRANYSILGIEQNTVLSSRNIQNCLGALNQVESVNTYFKRNRKNTDVFEQVLLEFTNYFFQRDKGAHTTAFVHLYRCIEYMSYCFPLIYASKTQDYSGTYKSLKNFLSGEQKSELKFFKAFQATLMGSSFLNSKIHLDIVSPTSDMKDIFNEIIRELCRGNIDSDSGGVITIKYEAFFDFIINLRNRYFHFMTGTNMKNISSKDISMDYFFKSVNEQIANWISLIYFEICRFGIENI